MTESTEPKSCPVLLIVRTRCWGTATGCWNSRGVLTPWKQFSHLLTLRAHDKVLSFPPHDSATQASSERAKRLLGLENCTLVPTHQVRFLSKDLSGLKAPQLPRKTKQSQLGSSRFTLSVVHTCCLFTCSVMLFYFLSGCSHVGYLKRHLGSQ